VLPVSRRRKSQSHSQLSTRLLARLSVSDEKKAESKSHAESLNTHSTEAEYQPTVKNSPHSAPKPKPKPKIGRPLLKTCPSHLCFLYQIVFNMLLHVASLARIGTYSLAPLRLSPSLSSSFAASSATSTFQMLPTVFFLALLNVQVSAVYSATFQNCGFCNSFLLFTVQFLRQQRFSYP